MNHVRLSLGRNSAPLAVQTGWVGAQPVGSRKTRGCSSDPSVFDSEGIDAAICHLDADRSLSPVR